MKDLGMSDGWYTTLRIAANVAALAVNIVGVKNCFKKGTLIACLNEYGEEVRKPIEEIEVGDRVLAYDESTGKQGYKKVVRLFRNETREWYHVYANGEEIVCTGGHPFYVAELDKFIPAKELIVDSKLLLSNGTYVIIEGIQEEELEEPETTYNFEVEDFHTYYVTESKLLVHNRCKLGINMEKEGKTLAADEDAHHLYPQNFKDKFKKINIDVDEAKYGYAMNYKLHRSRAAAYNKMWAAVINDVTEYDAETYMREFMYRVYEIKLP